LECFVRFFRRIPRVDEDGNEDKENAPFVFTRFISGIKQLFFNTTEDYHYIKKLFERFKNYFFRDPPKKSETSDETSDEEDDEEDEEEEKEEEKKRRKRR